MKIALVKSMDWGVISVHDWQDGQDDIEPVNSYIRVSEFMEVDFKMSADKDCIDRQLESLDAQEKTVMAAAEVKLNEIKQRKADLLALPAPELK